MNFNLSSYFCMYSQHSLVIGTDVFFLQAETDTRFADHEVQQQLRERDAEVRDLRVGIHSSYIVGNLAGVGGGGGRVSFSCYLMLN